MEIRTRRVGDVTVADLTGRLDSRTSGPASTELNPLAQAANAKLLLNVAGLEYVSSAGLRAILVAAKLADVNGGALKVCDANPRCGTSWRCRGCTASSTSTPPRPRR
jgi:anti-anti-sigma factor